MRKYLSEKETEKMFDLVEWKKMLSNVDKAVDSIDIDPSFKNKNGVIKQFQYIFSVLAQYFDGMKKKLEFFSFVRHRVLHSFHRTLLKPFYENIIPMSAEEEKILVEKKSSDATKKIKQEMKVKIETAEETYSKLAEISLEKRAIIKSENFDILKIHKKAKKILKMLNELNGFCSKYNMSWMEREIYLKICDETKKMKKRFLMERKEFEMLYDKSVELKASSVMLFKNFQDKKMERYQGKIERSCTNFDEMKKTVDKVLTTGDQEEKSLLLTKIKAQVAEMEKNYLKMEQRRFAAFSIS